MSLCRYLVKEISTLSTTRFVLNAAHPPSSSTLLKLQDKSYFSVFAARGENGRIQKHIRNPIKSVQTCYKHTQTENDQDLADFLKDEISAEEELVLGVPEFKHFKLQSHGTLVNLTRKFNNEHVSVSFDVNNNMNVDADDDLRDDDDDDDIDAANPDIVSYPVFAVKIERSGTVLEFNCSCNTGLNDEDDDDLEATEDGQNELFRFDDVKISTNDNTGYEAGSEMMDGELYSKLMTTLLERGIDGVFVNNLIDLSTAVEHKHYVKFLKTLHGFASGK